MSNDNEQAWREEQEFYQELVESGRFDQSEAQEIRKSLPLDLVRKMLGMPRPVQPPPPVDVAAEIRSAVAAAMADALRNPAPMPEVIPERLLLSSPDGSVWSITVNDAGRARTEKID